ncbi:neuronal tyrosine-phosphorylated phosphoinositide-3-kinase adapter 2 [Brachionichthys hirsutus]|uniref:neuronal tyrosine-phosphorylated phosphoinositide-3-kinase adapter 2 n=1 Tax=Brachionichthys hirsutus TaxID=412623 RepID=UPI0036047C6E
MASQEEAPPLRRFLQYVEDVGLRSYDSLVIQNASDIARESDRIRNQNNWTYLQEKHQKKRRQEEAIERIGEDVAMATEGAYAGKHYRMGSMTMPAPQDRLPPPSQGFTVRSQSLHSVGGGDDDADQNRKRPPPKPKRDPATKLSSSQETVDGGSRRDAPESAEARGEDCRKMPPPKPKRNPNTQLSASFDESFIHNHRNKTSSLRRDKCSSQSPASRDADDEDPVYIEMVGNVPPEQKGRDATEDDPSESVYEEMNYPTMEDFLQDTQSAMMDAESWLGRSSLCDIPPPFPNLLTPRPPLLVFPPAPAKCSPHSDESPLTPLDDSRLPMMDNVSYSKTGGAEHLQSSAHHCRDRDQDVTTTRTVTSSGRSSAPPLPSNYYQSSGSTHGGHGYPRSQSACPSPVNTGRPLTPLSLKRPPPYDALIAGGSMPRSSSSSSSSSHRAGEGGAKLSNSSSTHSSMQNVSMRSQTPTSPLDEVNGLFTSGRQVMKTGSGGRKSRENEGKQPDPLQTRFRTASEPHQTRIRPASDPLQNRFRPVSDPRTSSSPESKCKLGRSASTSGVPSPGGTQEPHHPVLSQMPWLCGDATMMEMIKKKRILCREIKARQRPEKNLCKQDSMPILPSWKRRQPPPYSAPPTARQGATVFWDSAI